MEEDKKSEVDMNVSQPKEKSIILYLFLLLISLLFLFYFFISRKPIDSNVSNNLQSNTDINSLDEEAPVSTTPQLKQWYLVDKTDSVADKIPIMPEQKQGYAGYIAQWHNLLFFDNAENDYKKVKIYSLNLDSKEIHPIFVEEDYDNLRGNVTSMQVIGNTLYFSIGAYISPSATFYLDLPITDTIKKLTDGDNRIMLIKNNYWIISGFGDGCGFSKRYSLINPTTKKITYFTDVGQVNGDGEIMLGIDNANRMLVASSTEDKVDIGDSCGTSIYTRVVALPILNPGTTVDVIREKDMPADIVDIHYIDRNNQLFLFGKSDDYIFDLSNGMISKSVTRLDRNQAISSESSSETFETRKKKINLPEQYEFVLE